MPAQQLSVNLLEQPEFEASSFSRLFNWSITYGRYIMIGTEVIVLLAFISRFSLDRKLTDLREEIAQKKIILEANQQFENDFKHLQNTLSTVKTLVSAQEKPLVLFYEITSVLPPDVKILDYNGGTKSLDVRFSAGTTESFSSVLSGLQKIKTLSNIEIAEIRKDTITGTVFRIRAAIK